MPRQPRVVRRLDPSTTQQRYWTYVDQQSLDGCWLWTGSVDSRGRGIFRTGYGRQALAHRYVLQLQGEDLTGAIVVHKCGFRLCVNPNHLDIVVNI